MSWFFRSGRWKKEEEPHLNPLLLDEVRRAYESGEISRRTYDRLLRVYFGHEFSGFTTDGVLDGDMPE